MTQIAEPEQTERAKVQSWRLHVLIEAGYPLPLAEKLANSEADLHRAVECRGLQLCEPCTTMQARTAPGAIKTLVHRAGLNAEILVGGEVRPGDAVVSL